MQTLRLYSRCLNTSSRLSNPCLGAPVGIRRFSKRTAIPSERNWDPHEIYPTEPGQVRVTGITLRDGHQSLNGGLHRIDLLEKAAVLIDKIRPPDMKYPGMEEIGGGTTVDFPLRFKGENPFRNMERISSKLPNTPTSCLIRADSLCGYSINPKDVTRKFLHRYAECGVDIFRIFDAYNNVANHVTGAEAVLDKGKHYQAAITFTSHADETLFNRAWVAKMATEFARLGAHSICIKDMAGISSPALMKAWVESIKDAVPELPVIIHSHYTTGFSPLTYLMAVQAGASGVDCGISTLSGRSGHPAMEVFNQVLADEGYDLGWDPKIALEAMKDVADVYREYHPRYEFCEMKMAGAVDYRVFTQGIPGGQISIMRNELVNNGFGHLFDNVIEQIQRVRTQVGGVALVTPTSEHVARQSIVNAMNNLSETTAESPLWPGYSEMLRGTMGRPPAKMEVSLQKRALKEWTVDIVKKMELECEGEVIGMVDGLVEAMWERARPVMDLADAKDLEDRIEQLEKMDAGKYAAQIGESQKELDSIRSRINTASPDSESEYTSILSSNPSESLYGELCRESGLDSLVKKNAMSRDQFLEIVKAASFCTVCPSTILPDGMERARLEVESLAVEHDFDIPDRGSIEFEEWAILQCMFRVSQNIALHWFKNHQTNVAYWNKHYPADFPYDRDEAKVAEDVKPLMYPFMSRVASLDDSARVLDYSDEELIRVFGSDLKSIRSKQAELEKLKAYQPENNYREQIKKRNMGRLESEIGVLEGKVETRLKSSMFGVKSQDAGYKVDVQASMGRLSQQMKQVNVQW